MRVRVSGSPYEAQAAALAHHGVAYEERFVDAPTVGGQAHVIVTGHGPPVVMLNGIGTPAAMWAPLMARLDGYTLFAIDLPAYGLTDTTASLTDDFRSTAVRFLDDVLDGLGLDHTAFVANSLGSLWAMWFAIDRPDRVSALVHVGCPAIVLDTSAPLPMRLATEQLPAFEATFLTTLHSLVRLRGARPHMALTRHQLAKVNQPTLLIFATNDPMGAAPVGQR